MEPENARLLQVEGGWRRAVRNVQNGEAISRTDSDRTLSLVRTISNESMPPLEANEDMNLPTLNSSDGNEDTLILQQPTANRYY